MANGGVGHGVGVTIALAYLLRRPAPSANPPATARLANPASVANAPMANAPQLANPVESRPQAALAKPGRKGFQIIAVIVASIAAIAGAAWYLQMRQRSATRLVSEYLIASAAPIPVRVTALELTFGPAGSWGCDVTFRAQLEAAEPLFRRLETADYLRVHAPADVAAIEAANALLRGPDGVRLRNAVADPAPTPAVPDLVLTAVQTPPGKTVTISGSMFAWRHDGGWQFVNATIAFDRTRLAGECKPPAAFAVDLPTDGARLSTLLAEHVA